MTTSAVHIQYAGQPDSLRSNNPDHISTITES